MRCSPVTQFTPVTQMILMDKAFQHDSRPKIGQRKHQLRIIFNRFWHVVRSGTKVAVRQWDLAGRSFCLSLSLSLCVCVQRPCKGDRGAMCAEMEEREGGA